MPSKSHHSLKERNKQQSHSSLERLMVLVAVAEPLMTIPQIYELYSPHGNGGVSAVTWLLYLFASIMWLLYGIKRQNRPLIISGILWVVVESLVVVGVFIK